jgi:hypothetical protein
MVNTSVDHKFYADFKSVRGFVVASLLFWENQGNLMVPRYTQCGNWCPSNSTQNNPVFHQFYYLNHFKGQNKGLQQNDLEKATYCCLKAAKGHLRPTTAHWPGTWPRSSTWCIRRSFKGLAKVNVVHLPYELVI